MLASMHSSPGGRGANTHEHTEMEAGMGSVPACVAVEIGR